MVSHFQCVYIIRPLKGQSNILRLDSESESAWTRAGGSHGSSAPSQSGH